MKTLTATLAILLTTLAPMAIGCVASTGDEAAESNEALANNNPDRTMADLKKDGWSCTNMDGTMVCMKEGTNTIYFCKSDGVCVAKPKPPVVIGQPILVPPRREF